MLEFLSGLDNIETCGKNPDPGPYDTCRIINSLKRSHRHGQTLEWGPRLHHHLPGHPNKALQWPGVHLTQLAGEQVTLILWKCLNVFNFRARNWWASCPGPRQAPAPSQRQSQPHHLCSNHQTGHHPLLRAIKNAERWAHSESFAWDRKSSPGSRLASSETETWLDGE